MIHTKKIAFIKNDFFQAYHGAYKIVVQTDILPIHGFWLFNFVFTVKYRFKAVQHINTNILFHKNIH